jgi:hypothetical protein
VVNLRISIARLFLVETKNLKFFSNLFKAYKDAGYNFGVENPDCPIPFPVDFLRQLGRAKHEPCGEHWNVSYGDSAW